MTTRSLILLLVFTTSIIVTVKSDGSYRVELLDPQGFRVSTPNAPGLKAVSFFGRFDPDSLIEPGVEYTGEFTLESNGWWTYRNTSAPLNPNDTFQLSLIKEFEGAVNYEVGAEEYIVPANGTRVPV